MRALLLGGVLLLASCGYSPGASCTRHSDCAPGDYCLRGHCDPIPDGGADVADAAPEVTP